MPGARQLFGRLQRRADEAEGHPEPLDVPALVAALERLSPAKQIAVRELWTGPEIVLADGLTVTARSKKERRRFTRPVEAEMLVWLDGLAAGDVLYDIGANCGSLTLAAAARHGAAVTIVAIEPGWANYESLARNLSANGLLGSVIPLQLALLDRTRLEPIHYYGSTAAGTSLHAVGRPVDYRDEAFVPVETQMVPTFCLDDLMDALQPPAPTHVKIDVDGTEVALLRGAERTLAQGQIREILVEIVDHDSAGSRLAAVRELLEPHGYAHAAVFGHPAGDGPGAAADHLFRRAA